MHISAQVSLYPLGEADLAPSIEAVLEVFRTHGLRVDVGAMSTVLSGPDDDVFGALHEAFRTVAAAGQAVMVVTLSNACPIP